MARAKITRAVIELVPLSGLPPTYRVTCYEGERLANQTGFEVTRMDDHLALQCFSQTYEPLNCGRNLRSVRYIWGIEDDNFEGVKRAERRLYERALRFAQRENPCPDIEDRTNKG